MAVIDNKLITLRRTAGYSLEPVISLWYAKKSEERKKKQWQNADRKATV